MSHPSKARVRATVLSAVAAALVLFGNGPAAAQTGTLPVCVNAAGVFRMSATCRPNEQPYVLVTESALAALRADLEAANAALAARVAALELTDAAQDGRLAALEAADLDHASRLAGLESVATALTGSVEDLQSQVGELERTVVNATFTKVFDGGHYASYVVTGTGFRPASTVTTGVGTTAIVEGGGTFSVFGGNLFCAETVTVSGTDVNGNVVVRSAPVECNSEMFPPVVVTFTKVFDGGHYASYTISGSGFLAGSTVTSGVGLTATVAGDGTFSVFGGNLFCSDTVTLDGTGANGSPVSRSAPVQCDSEP